MCENLLLNNTSKVQRKENAATKERKCRTLMTKTLMIPTLKMSGINVVNHQKNNGLSETKAVGKEKYVYLNEMNGPIVLEPELKSFRKFKVSKLSKIFKKLKIENGKTRLNLIKATVM